MSSKPIVYSKPACVQCTAVTRALDAKGVEYEYIDLTETPDAMDSISKYGYRQAPVVVFGDFHFCGFNPQKVQELVERVNGAELQPDF